MTVSSVNSKVSAVGKAAYVYDSSDDTWYPVAGSTNPGANIDWTGTQSFAATTTFKNSVVAQKGINVYLNATIRNAAMPSPVTGAMCFLQTTPPQLQYYDGSAWRLYGDDALLSTKNSSLTIAFEDAGRTLDIDSSSNVTVSIPKNSVTAFPIGSQISFIQSGTGSITFAAVDGAVTSILSKNSNKKIASRYSAATLIKKSTDAWYLIGDLTA